MRLNKNIKLLFVIVLLSFSMACSLIGGAVEELESAVDEISESAEDVISEAVEEAMEDAMGEDQTMDEAPSQEQEGGAESVENDFPIPAGVENMMDVNGTIIYQVNMSLADVMAFYRTEYTSLGLTERELLTVVSDSTFSIVFDGSPNGMAVVIQGVDLGGGKTNVSIRYEDV